MLVVVFLGCPGIHSAEIGIYRAMMRKSSLNFEGTLTPKQAHNANDPKTEVMRHDRKVDDLRWDKDTPNDLE